MIGRLAGTVLKNTFSPKNLGYLLPDMAYGTMSAVMSPGDGADKAVAGGSDFLLSALAGGAVRSLPGMRNAPAVLQMGGDMAAGMAGANAGMALSDGVQRLRYGGQTLLEQQREQEIALIKQQAVNDTLLGLGLHQSPQLGVM